MKGIKKSIVLENGNEKDKNANGTIIEQQAIDDSTKLQVNLLAKLLEQQQPVVTAKMLSFLNKEGAPKVLTGFVTRNHYPVEVLLYSIPEIKESRLSDNDSEDDLTTEEDSIPLEIKRSYRAMDLFLNPSPPFLQFMEEQLSVLLSSLFSIFPVYSKDASVSPLPPTNLHHFSKTLYGIVFAQSRASLSIIGKELYLERMIPYFSNPQLVSSIISISNIKFQNAQDTTLYDKLLGKLKFWDTLYQEITSSSSNQESLEGIFDMLLQLIESFESFKIPIKHHAHSHKNHHTKEGKKSKGKNKEKKAESENNQENSNDEHPPFLKAFQTYDFLVDLMQIVSGKKKHVTFSLLHQQLAMKVIVKLVAKSKEMPQLAPSSSLFLPTFLPPPPSPNAPSWLNFISDSIDPLFDALLNKDNFVTEGYLSTHKLSIVEIICDLTRTSETQHNNTHTHSSDDQLPVDPDSLVRKILDIIPSQLWGVLVDWFLFYKSNNIFHSKFFDIVKSAIKLEHETSLKALFVDADFVTKLINSLQEKKEEKYRSENRGFTLLFCNYIRLMSDSQPHFSFLPHFLISHSLWQTFLPDLKKETLRQVYSPIPIPLKGNMLRQSEFDLFSSYGSSPTANTPQVSSLGRMGAVKALTGLGDGGVSSILNLFQQLAVPRRENSAGDLTITKDSEEHISINDNNSNINNNNSNNNSNNNNNNGSLSSSTSSEKVGDEKFSVAVDPNNPDTLINLGSPFAHSLGITWGPAPVTRAGSPPRSSPDKAPTSISPHPPSTSTLSSGSTQSSEQGSKKKKKKNKNK